METQLKRKVAHGKKRSNSNSKTPSKAKSTEVQSEECSTTDWIDSTFFSDDNSPKHRRPPRKKHVGKVSVSQTVIHINESETEKRIQSDCIRRSEQKHVGKEDDKLSISSSELFDDDFAWLTQGTDGENKNGDKDFGEIFSDTDNALAEMDLDIMRSPRPIGVKAEDATAVVSPKNGKRRSSLLSRKLKQTLLDNAKAPPADTARLLAKAHELKMAEALKEAEEIKNTKASDFVQPFGGLPDKVLELFESLRGIKELYDWQKECLCLPEVRQGKNLIYSLPTSGGKTLVAEVLIFRQLLIRKLDAILILPFVAIVQEKVRIIGAFASELDFVVEEYAAGKGQIPPRERHKRNVLYIATIEKSSALVNSLIENKRMASVGLVVVDELHMLGEGGSRGSTLETTITKVMHQSAGTQIIGMSATLNNIKDLQKFLSAQVFSNDFRPVQLKEYVKLDDGIYEVNSSALCPEDQLQLVRAISYKCSKEMKLRDPDQIVALVQEVVPQHSCLVFCPTKKNCENVAELLSCFLPRDEMLSIKSAERKLLLKQLVQEGSGELCRVLRRTIPFGIAYHHSGLTADERRAIEDAYSDGVLCVLACTSTLAAGVNLPAKRVVLRSPYVADTFLSRNQYKQMVGRAGRAGIDSSGESVLILQRKDKVKLANMLIGPNEQCCSSLLYESHKGLRSLLLSTIGLKITASTQSVKAFIQRTLCFIQRSQLKVDLLQNAENALQRLHEMGLITQKTPDSLETTRLGQAVFKGGVDIEFGSQLYSDLKRGLESLVLSNHLHLIFLVTPYDRLNAFTPNWNVYMDMMYSFDENELRVASMIGISEGYIVNKAACQRTRKNVNEAVVRRFYASLILYELWQQKSIWDVSRKFSVPRGQIQQLLTSAASFASCVLHFCQELEELWSYQELLAVFVKRLSYCVTAELIPLVEIPGVKIARAKQLFQGGFKTLQQIASTEPHALVNCVEHLSHKAAKQIIISAQVLLTERAEALREEAEGMEISLAEKSPHHATIVN